MQITDYNRASKLFIIGVPKCGTTSLYNLLLRNNFVIPHQRKEPHYYSSDVGYTRFSTFQSYIDGFHVETVNETDRRPIIDGSVWYLYSDHALESITNLNGEVKIIVMFREPSAMIKSLFHYNLLKGYEKRQNFEKALRSVLTSVKIEDNKSYHSLDYHKAINFRRRIEKFDRVLGDDLLIIDMDEFTSGSKSTFKALSTFLKVDLMDDNLFDIPHENKKRSPRSVYLSKFIYRWRYSNRLDSLRKIYQKSKVILKFDLFKILKIINERPSVLRLSQIEKDLLSQIQKEYEDDYIILQRLKDKSQSKIIGHSGCEKS